MLAAARSHHLEQFENSFETSVDTHTLPEVQHFADLTGLTPWSTVFGGLNTKTHARYVLDQEKQNVHSLSEVTTSSCHQTLILSEDGSTDIS